MMTAAVQAGPMVLAAYGKAMGVTPATSKDEPAAAKTPEAEALDRLKASQRNDRRNAIGDAKGRAREKLQKLLEKLKLLTKMKLEA
uniref:hypothetical protein n=1 Tax=uncultured Caulobacter sp. TaxID=158749 RepID=UPI0025D4FCC1|nr:hypothetical protein [uncultured Caulobacter sp.]